MPEEAEEKERLPAVGRREVEISRGVVLLPPAKRAEPLPPERAERPERPRHVMFPHLPPWMLPLVFVACAVAIVAFFVAIAAWTSLSAARAQLAEVVEKLEAFRAREVRIKTVFFTNHTGIAEVPLAQAVPKFKIPFRGVVPMVVELPIVDPLTGVVLRVEKRTINATVDFDLPVDPANVTGVLTIRYEIAPEGEVAIRVKMSDIFAENLDTVIEKLKAIAR